MKTASERLVQMIVRKGTVRKFRIYGVWRRDELRTWSTSKRSCERHVAAQWDATGYTVSYMGRV